MKHCYVRDGQTKDVYVLHPFEFKKLMLPNHNTHWLSRHLHIRTFRKKNPPDRITLGTHWGCQCYVPTSVLFTFKPFFLFLLFTDSSSEVAQFDVPVPTWKTRKHGDQQQHLNVDENISLICIDAKTINFKSCFCNRHLIEDCRLSLITV
jgi:hypothetical protein